jgi:Ca2+-binding RTX toxin-like protein
MADLPVVEKINYDGDNVFVRAAGTALTVQLNRELSQGQSLELTYGDVVLDIPWDFPRSGVNGVIAKTGQRVLVSVHENSVSIISPEDMADGHVVTATVIADGVRGPVATQEYTIYDKPTDGEVGSFMNDVAAKDALGRATTLLDSRSTQLALIDVSAAWCGPSIVAAQGHALTLQLLGDSFDYKTLLQQDIQFGIAGVAEAARWKAIYNIPTEDVVVFADAGASYQFMKYLDVPLPTFLIVDQVTGEVFGRFSGAADVATTPYLIAQGAASALDFVRSVAAEKGITASVPNDDLLRYDGGQLYGTVRADILTGYINDDLLDGGYGNDRLDGGDGDDVLLGGEGDDVLIGGQEVNPWAGLGFTEQDILSGGGGDDRIFGGADADGIDGGTGDDVIDGGLGDDVIKLSAHSGSDAIDGGAGFDQLDFSTAGGAVRFSVDAQGAQTFEIDNDDAAEASTVRSVEHLVGTDFADLLIGSTGNDRLEGGRGDDELQGGAGDDRVRIGDNAGNDIVDGGAGFDVLDLNPLHSGSSTTFDGLGRGSYTFDDGSAGTFTGIESLAGTFGNDIVTGSDAAERVNGWGGDDEFHLGGGNDTVLVTENSGNDILSGEDGRDQILFVSSAAVRYEHLDGQPATYSNLDGSGGEVWGFEWITGSDHDDVLIGGADEDQIDGGAGNDFIQAGEGAVTLRGEDGDDTLDMRNGALDVNLNGGGGIDTADFSAVAGPLTIRGTTAPDLFEYEAGEISFGLIVGVERVIGTGFDDHLVGGGANNSFEGGAGDDRLDGGEGDDLLNAGEGSDELIGGNGFDRAAYTWVSGAMRVALDSTGAADVIVAETVKDTLTGMEGILAGSGADVLTGNGVANILNGGGGDDLLIGGGTLGEIADQLIGGGGNDVLRAGAGATIGNGGSGDDRFNIASASLEIVFNGGAGTDTIDLSAAVGAVTLSLEPAALFEPAAFDVAGGTRGSLYQVEEAIGSGFADLLTGSKGDDILTGSGGMDILTGGGGADLFRDTLAGLSRDTLRDLSLDDRVLFTDARLDGFEWTIRGDTVTYQGVDSNGASFSSAFTATDLALRQFVAQPVSGTTGAAGGQEGVMLVLERAGSVVSDVRTDFDGDGRDDIFWTNGQGATSNWRGTASGGFAVNDGMAMRQAPTGAHVAGFGDFDGDGRSDVLWQSAGNQLQASFGSAGGGFIDGAAVTTSGMGPGWGIAAIGDFDGDGRDELLGRNGSSGELASWSGAGLVSGTLLTARASGTVATDWHVTGTGDFNGDGRDDILWRNEDGRVSNWLGDGQGGFTVNDHYAMIAAPVTWQVVGTGDFNGDGRADVLWRSETGALSNWLGTAAGSFANNDVNAMHAVSNAWQVADTGDFNGDGRADLLWQARTGEASTWLGTAAGGFDINDANAMIAGVGGDWEIHAQTGLWI